MHGDLEQYLHYFNEPSKKQLACYQICSAVAFLHSSKPPIIHRDLKPANVLVKFAQDKFILKLGDFGLCRTSFTLSEKSKNRGTIVYMAPVRNFDKNLFISLEPKQKKGNISHKRSFHIARLRRKSGYFFVGNHFH